MSDSFTRTTSTNWFTRIGQSIGGVLFGIILFIAAFPVLSWNEGRAVNRARTLESGAKSVVSVEASPIDAANEGKLVHVTGTLAVATNPTDDTFGVTATAVKLRRNVEMYQWEEESKSETRNKLGGGEETVTTYTYTKTWSPSLIDSANFAEPAGHGNPAELPVEPATFTATDVTVGDFTLPASLTDRIDNFEPLAVTEIPANLADQLKLSKNGFYVGANPAEPVVGDVRITFEFAPIGPVSIIAGQFRKTFEPFAIGRTGTIELLQTGTVSAQAMFESERQANVLITWLIRLGGFLMMVFGLSLIAAPLPVLADVIPFIGTIVRTGVGLFAFLIAIPLTLITIAIAWIAVRPLIGIPILLLAVAAVVAAVWLIRQKSPRLPAKPA